MWWMAVAFWRMRFWVTCSVGHFHWWSFQFILLICSLCPGMDTRLSGNQDFFICPKLHPPLPPASQGFLKIQMCYWHSASPSSYRKCLYHSVEVLAIYLLGLLRTQLYRLKSEARAINYTKFLAVYHTCDNLLQETGRGTLFLYSCEVSWVGCFFLEFCLTEIAWFLSKQYTHRSGIICHILNIRSFLFLY